MELNLTERYPRKWGTRSSHNLVLSVIGAGRGRRALDVGCAQGHLLAELASRDWECVGVDTDTDDVAACVERGLVAVELDITNDPLERLGTFDLVVFADVLEHLPEPHRVLQDFHSLLNPDARVVISVPNVAHVSVRAQLLFGRFRYSARGILDSTHLRFFTHQTIIDLLIDADFTIDQIMASAVPLEIVWPAITKTRFGRKILALNDLLPRFWKGGFAYQFIVLASPSRSA